MISIENFSLGYGSKKLLNDVNTTFLDGQLTALIGRNGSGKSTLLKALCGINQNYEGKILINHEDLKKFSPLKLAKTISYVNTQRPRISNLKVKDVVALGRSPHTGWHGKLNSKDQTIIDESLALVGMDDFSERQLSSLSDGESQKIMIARAIAQDTPIMLLDEPTSFLDLPTRYEIVKLLKQLSSQGKTVLYSTHELDIAMDLSDNIALFDNGKNKTSLVDSSQLENLTGDIINLPVKEMKTSGHLSRLFCI